MTKKREPEEESQPDSAGVADLPTQTAEEANVQYSPEPPAGDEGRKIHPRRKLPSVPEGADEPDLDPSPPADIKPPQCQ